MAEKKNAWVMNDTQKKFMEILAENANGITLREIKKAYGIEFKTGSINTLKVKGLVDTSEKRTFVAEIVYDGEVIGRKTYNDTVYKLVSNAD